jgi:hypothetical protein
VFRNLTLSEAISAENFPPFEIRNAGDNLKLYGEQIPDEVKRTQN